MDSLNILMVAYACDPEGGGEHWLGWGWALEASRDHEVTLVTTSKAGASLQCQAAEHGMDVHFLDVPAWMRKVTEFCGAPGTWLRKFWWQGMALNLARQLHAKNKFHLVHQTTFHTFRIPFSCSRLGIPSVWGPVAGGESVPSGYDNYLGAGAASEKRRSALNRLNLAMPWVRSSLQRVSIILVSNRTTLKFLPTSVHRKCVVMSPNALREEDMGEAAPERPAGERFEMLFAGNCAPTRAMPLVFEALALGLPVGWRLRVVGAGAALDFWKSEVSRLGLGEQVEFTGLVPRDTLKEIYSEAPVLVFPGLRDSGGSALLEAMTLALPILTFDWGGPGEMVDKDSAIIVEVTAPSKTIVEINSGLSLLATRPEEGRRLGLNARQRALDYFPWEKKRMVVDRIYRDLTR